MLRLTALGLPAQRLATVVNPASCWYFLSSGFQRSIFLFQQNGTENILFFVDLADGESGILAAVGLRLKKVSKYLVPRDTVVRRNLEDVLSAATDVGHEKKVGGSRESQLAPGQKAYAAHCKSASCVEAADVNNAQRLQRSSDQNGSAGTQKRSALLSDFRCIDSDLVGLFTTRQVCIM